MPTLDLEGVRLYYEEKGAGEPVVFCHGIPTDFRAWNLQAEHLSDRYRTICYSRRYAAPNTRAGDVTDSTIANNANDLAGFIRKLGAAPTHLVGHSYGGFVAAYVAAEHPELVRSLILVEPAIATLLVENPASSSQLLSLLFRSPSVALSARRFQNRSLNPSLAALDAGQTQRAVELNVDGVQDRAGAFRALPEAAQKMMTDNVKTIAELRTQLPAFKAMARRVISKTLVLNGDSGALWLRKVGELTAAAIPGATVSLVPGCRHFPHMENPSEFNRLLDSFLSKGT